MKYAKKMILISEEEYRQLLELKKSQGKVGELKNKVKKVLREKPTHSAAKRMSQIVGEYLRYKKAQTTPQNASQEVSQKKKKLNLLQFFTPTYHEKVKTVMSFLEAYGVTLTDKMEVISSNGDVIPNSNIVDLLKEALVATKRKERVAVPTGWPEFIQEVANSNAPLNLFTKRTTLGDIRHLRDNQPWANF